MDDPGRRQTIALVYNTDIYLQRFRGGLLRALRDRGYEVFAIAPAGPAVPAIEADAITFVHWPLARRSMNPISEVASIVRLWRIYRRIRPDIVHHFTPKPNIYGAFAARLGRVPVAIASVNGLGFVFTGDDIRATVARPLLSVLYRLAFRLSAVVLVQSRDDAKELQDAGLLSKSKCRAVPGGSGVDIEEFAPRVNDLTVSAGLRDSLGIPGEATIVLLIARMLWHKGIREFVEAARRIGSKSQVHFLMVGSPDEGNPASVTLRQLQDWAATGWVKYLGERSDVRDLLAMADIVVLPSYREGFPRVLMEASAMAKAIIATDVPGCREVIEQHVTGVLVPPRNADALLSAIEKLLAAKHERDRLGVAARHKALRDFDEKTVIKSTVMIYESLLTTKTESRDV